MYFGGTGCTAASVPSGTSAKQNDDVSRIGSLPNYILSGSCTHYCPDFHSFRHIGRMINLLHKAGGQSNLIPIGRIAVSSAPHQLFLRQLAFQSIRNRNCGICRPGHTHGLIYIPSSGKGISNRTAQAGGSTPERLYLRWMVVGLIFEKHQPFLNLLMAAVIHLHGHHHRAGVNLIRLLHVRQLSFFFQLPHGHESQVHQTDKPVRGSVSVNLFPGIQIAAVSGLNGRAVISLSKLHLLQLRGKGRMTTVI